MQQHVTVPAFAFSDDDWTRLEQAAPIAQIVVYDIGMGDIDPEDPNAHPWGEAGAKDRVQQAQSAGLKVLGYVPTDDGTSASTAPTNDGSAKAPHRTLADIQRYADRWYALCPIDGIFFDEGPYPDRFTVTQEVRDYYQGIYNYVKGQTAGRDTVVMLNAAGYTEDWVTNAADVLVLWEESEDAYLNRYPAPPSWVTSFPPERIAHVVHTCPTSDEMRTVVTLSQQRGAGHVYVYDGTSAAYNRLPSYWDEELAAVDATTSSGQLSVVGPLNVSPAEAAEGQAVQVATGFRTRATRRLPFPTLSLRRGTPTARTSIFLPRPTSRWCPESSTSTRNQKRSLTPAPTWPGRRRS